ncbi:MAG: hypothetical protein HKN26_13150 [Acidimicrobiales bacterium]|nr:hypothetical protein [Acidimicrobiales bacterium]
MAHRPTAWAQQMQKLHGPRRASLATRLLRWLVTLATLVGIVVVLVILLD